MLAWVLNTPLVSEDSSNVLFLYSVTVYFTMELQYYNSMILHYKTPKICYLFKVLFNSSNSAIKHLIN